MAADLSIYNTNFENKLNTMVTVYTNANFPDDVRINFHPGWLQYVGVKEPDSGSGDPWAMQFKVNDTPGYSLNVDLEHTGSDFEWITGSFDEVYTHFRAIKYSYLSTNHPDIVGSWQY
jgi:hypothetical protein